MPQPSKINCAVRNSAKMETVKSPGNTWLDQLSKRLQYEPDTLGSGYQPMGTFWKPHPVSSDLRMRRSNSYVTFHREGRHHMLFAGGLCLTRGQLCNDVIGLRSGSDELETISASAEWSPRQNFVFLSTIDGSHIFVIGGESHEIAYDVWLSTDLGRSFKMKCQEVPWKGRVDIAASLSNSTIVVAGGRVPERYGPGRLLNDVWISEDLGKTWSCVCDKSPWMPRAYASLVYSKGNLILLGGLTEVTVVDDVWTSADTGRSWTRVSVKPVPWRARRALSTAVDRLSGEILIFGGVNGEGMQLTDSWASIDSGSTWIPRKPVPSLGSTSPVNASCDDGQLVLYNSNHRIETLSDLKYIRRDCQNILMLGARLESIFPRDIWVNLVTPYAVDFRVLSKREGIPFYSN